MLAWLSVWSEVQTCIWPSWCHCHSLPLASVKSRWVYLSGTGYPGSPGQRAIKRVYVCMFVTYLSPPLLMKQSVSCAVSGCRTQSKLSGYTRPPHCSMRCHDDVILCPASCSSLPVLPDTVDHMCMTTLLTSSNTASSSATACGQ